MNHTIKTVRGIILIILCVPFLVSSGEAQVGISLKAVGRVFSLNDTTRIGTAFVAGKTKSVFLASHEAKSDTLLFAGYKSNHMFRIAVKFVLEEFDLAIFERTGGEPEDSYPLGDFSRLRPGDKLIYFGWKTDNLLGTHSSSIASTGETLNQSQTVPFIEFYGDGAPGYSGGPVFNMQGEVVAMIVQGWDEQNVKTGTLRRKMRAFSIEPLRMINQELKTSVETDSLEPGEGLRLFDLMQEN